MVKGKRGAGAKRESSAATREIRPSRIRIVLTGKKRECRKFLEC
jgi:hypothetical protein